MRRLLLVMALVFVASVAQAESGLFYFGAGLTTNKLNDITVQGNALPDLNGQSWKLFAGFRPISAFALEADYLDLGHGTAEVYTACTVCCMIVCNEPERSDSEAQAFAAYALGFLPLPVPYLDIYGKAGLSRWKLSGSDSHSGAFTDHGTSFAWGVGIQAHSKIVGLRLEYEDFSITHTSGAKVASMSLFAVL
jgi:Outer membrane protein beta-barrel domain